MKKIFLILVFSLCAAGAAHAQAPVATTDDLTQGFLALANWRTLGVLALFSTIVNILVNLYKRYGTYVPLPWRPVIALLLGIVGSVVAALVTGAPLANALVLGVPAGFASGGGAIALHEAWSTIKALFSKKDVTKTIAGIGIGVMCMAQTGCVKGWTAAEKAAPACYGLKAADLTTLVSEGKQIAVSTAAGCVAGTASCISAVEGAVGTYLANKALDDQAFLCATEAIKLEIQYPNGGEDPYSPDAGPAPAKMAKVLGSGGSGLSDSDMTAVEGLNSLTFNRHNYQK